jgi:photosystem II stability/assembly factor-like uncharacterized protein
MSDYVYALAVASASKDTYVCYAAKQSGLYRSFDRGAHWSCCFGKVGAVTAICISPTFEQDAILYAAAAGGVFVSTDAGETWMGVPLASPAPVVSAFAISPAHSADGILLAASLEDGVFRSINSGAGWSGWNFGLYDHRVNCLAISPDFAHDQTVFAGTDTGLFISRNGGRSWSARADDDLTCVTFIGLSPNFGLDRRLWIATEKDGLLESKDAGHSFDYLYRNLPQVSIQALIPLDEKQIALALEREVVVMRLEDNRIKRLFHVPDDVVTITTATIARLEGDDMLVLIGDMGGNIHAQVICGCL